MMPITPQGEMPTFPAGLEPVIETRRGIRGVLVSGLWSPLPIMGGDGEGDGGSSDDSGAGDGGSSNTDGGSGGSNNQQMFSREYVEQLRKEAGDNRVKSKDLEKQLADVQQKLADIDKEKLSETERLKVERDEAVAKAEQAEKNAAARLLHAAVIVEASGLKFHDPEDGFRYIDQSALQRDADGNATNIKKLLEDLVKAKPYLVKNEEGGGAGPEATPKGSGPKSHDQVVASTRKELQESGRYASLT